MGRKWVIAFTLLLANPSTSAYGAEEASLSSTDGPQSAGKTTAFAAPSDISHLRSRLPAFATHAIAITGKSALERCYDLRATVRQHGFVTVKVDLNIPNLPDETRVPPEYRSAMAQTRRRAIARAQAILVERMAPLNVISSYTFSPEMEIVVDTKGLEDLIENPDVRYIRRAEKSSRPCGKRRKIG